MSSVGRHIKCLDFYLEGILILNLLYKQIFRLQKSFAFGDVGLKKALAQKWIEYYKSTGGNALRVTPKGMEAAVDEVCLQLRQLEAGDNAQTVSLPDALMKDFKKRNLIDKKYAP